MADDTNITKAPYNFGTAIFKPFKSGPGSLGFVLKSGIFYALAVTMLLAIFGRMVIGPYIELITIAIEQEASGDPVKDEMEMMGEMMSVMGKMMSGYIIIMLGGWAVWAMIESALHRRVLRKEYKTGLFPWRFHHDELRTMLSQLILYGAYMGLFYVVYFAAIILVLIAVLLGSKSMVLGVIIGVIAAAIIIVGFAVMIRVLIRLAPMAARNVAQNELVIDKAWAVGKGRSWPSFGAYAFHYFISSIVFYIVGAILFFAVLGSLMPMFDKFNENMETDEVMQILSDSFSQPGMMVGLTIITFVMCFMGAVWMMCIAGISSHVTELYMDEQEQEGARVFD